MFPYIISLVRLVKGTFSVERLRNDKYHIFSKTFIYCRNQFAEDGFRKNLSYERRTVHICLMFLSVTNIVRLIKRDFFGEKSRNKKYHTFLKTFIRRRNRFVEDGFWKNLPYERRTVHILTYVSLSTNIVRLIKRDFFGEEIKKRKISYILKNLYSSS